MMKIKSLYGLFSQIVTENPTKISCMYKKSNTWHDVTWRELNQDVNTIASYLIKLKIKKGDKIIIFSDTRMEWSIADLAILALGCITVPIFSSSSDYDINYIIKDSSSKFAFVENKLLLKKIINNSKIESTNIIVFSDLDNEDKTPSISFINLLKKPIIVNKNNIINYVNKNDIASIVYTSGTTGNPKGVLLTNYNFISVANELNEMNFMSSDGKHLLFLPLAHIFARLLQFFWIINKHILVYAENMDQLMVNLQETKPILMCSVPRMYEKIYDQIILKTQDTKSIIKQILLKIALKSAIKAATIESKNKKHFSILWWIIRKTIMKKIANDFKEKLGGKIKMLISGGASLNPEVIHFFKYIDINIFEGYGLTETTAATCLNNFKFNKIGTVGKPVGTTQVRLANDGELEIKGDGLFLGYFNNIIETKNAFTKDGWFKTGDIGIIDKEYVKITNRKKEIIVTSGGKNIYPQKIEILLKTQSPIISQVVICGHGKKFIIAIITINKVNALKYFNNMVSIDNNIKILEEIQNIINKVNKNLARYEQIKKFAILKKDIIVGKELTSTYKIKRFVFERNNKELIDSLYN